MKKNLRMIVDYSASINNFKVNNNKNNGLLIATRNYSREPKIKERKELHPYKKIHPWKSIEQFSKYLVDNVIYNEDGLVVLNKPYGISNKPLTITRDDPDWYSAGGMPNSVDFTLFDVLPNVAEKLGHTSLGIVKSPEKNISGVAILAANEKKTKQVKKALSRSQCSKNFAKTYWIVTTKLPKSEKGELNLAITKKESPCKTYKQPIILTKWGANKVKRGEVKTFDVSYNTISNSEGNLASLMEIKCFTTKWHAIRVFASTVLISPILGDRIHGSRVKKVMGTFMHISPFVEAARDMPILTEELLAKLRLTAAQRVIIPTHIHLREVELMSFNAGQNLKLVAPLPESFQWTCEQLQFEIPTLDEEFPEKTFLGVSQ